MGMSVEEIDKALSELTSKVNAMLESVAPLQEEVTELNTLEDEVTREFQKRVEEIRTERYEKRKAIRDVEVKAHDIKNAMAQLERQRAEALAEIAAQARLDEIYGKLAEYIKNAPWAKAIKDFQKEDVAALYKAYYEGENGALNANVMGAGKTFETAAFITIFRSDFIKEHNRRPNIVWLTRKSLMKSTADELRRWDGEIKCALLQGNLDMRNATLDLAIMANLVVVANYEATNSTPRLREFEWDLIIMDECHKMKGGEKVQLFHHTRNMTEKAKFFLGLSGSPIQNKPEDIWPIFHILDPMRFPTTRRFTREFTTEVYDKAKNEYVVQADEKRLLRVMAGKVIKQDPKIVQAAWPDKRRIFKVVEHDEKQRAVYNRVKNGVLSYFAKMNEDDPNKTISITAIIAQLTYLRQVNVWPAGVTVKSPDGDEVYRVDCNESSKLDEAEALIDELVGEGEQVVVWSSQFNEPLYELERRVRELGHTVAIMNGDTKDARAVETLFQDGSIDVLLCNRMAVSEGFNFQKNPDRWEGGSSNAVFLDQWWNPKANEQAEDRIWRTGANEPVTIYYILADDSVDAFIAAKLEAKEKMIDGIMNSEQLRPSEVLDLLEDLL